MALGTAMLVVILMSIGGTLAFPSSGLVEVDKLPDTSFSCEGKVIGGYYADIESGCQMFHVCTLGDKGEIRDIKFLCLNGTIFDQETRVCERLDEVNCSQSTQFYNLNLDLFGSHGIILGRSVPPKTPEDGLFDEEAQATSIAGDEDYVDYEDYDADATIVMAASNQEAVVTKVELIDQEESVPRIVNATGITVTNGEPFLPVLRKKRSPAAEEDRQTEILPETSFSCFGRVLGGLYADIEAGCRIFHICAQGKKNRIVDYKFACGVGTLFDQASRTCQEAAKVNCELSEKFYHLNDHSELTEKDHEAEFDFPRIHKHARDLTAER